MLRRLLYRFATFSRAQASGVDAADARTKTHADQLIGAGDRCERAGDIGEACKSYRKAVEVAPGYARAHLNLGTGLEALGDTEGAMRCYEAALALDPAEAYASYNLGRLLLVRGSVAGAAERLQAALKHKPGFPEALVTLSSLYEAQGDLEAAAGALKAALESRGEWAGALLNYGGILKKLGRFAQAEAALRRALGIEPANVDAMYELATLLYARRALPEAEQLLQQALRHKPDFPQAYATLFDVYDAKGDLERAAAALEHALKQRPDWVEALHNYGTVLQKLRRLRDAESALRRAIAIAPEFPFAHESLGAVLFNQSRITEAVESFRTAQRLAPERLEAASAELFVLNHADGISCESLFFLHKEVGARIEEAHPPRFMGYRNSRDEARRLRIGYVSGDFNHHPVTFFLLPLLEQHDRSQFDIACYSASKLADEFTARVKAGADRWREVASLSTNELADLINTDGIDVLVDLSGHSGTVSLPVFAQQPAPVQAAWLGYPNTTGLTRIQYRICDPYTDPPGVTDPLCTEKLIRLPYTQWCYRPPAVVEIPTMPPVKRNGYVTFGSFNQAKKLSPSTQKLWADILKRVPDSRLAVAGVSEKLDRVRLLRAFEESGIDGDRLSFLPHASVHEYFRRITDVDIALDTTPYSGCTTTFDTLWMGVPVVTLRGAAPASRVTAGILAMLGLDDWIASTQWEYVTLAVKFCQHEGVIEALRRELRRKLHGSPIMDAPGFARAMENAYRTMWRSWCDQSHV